MERLERLLVNRTVVYDIHEAMGDSAEAIADYSTDIDLGWLGDRFPLRHRRAAMYSADRDLVPSAVADLTRRFPDVVAADWESASIARVAVRRRTRVLILRAASDLVSEKHGEAAGNLPLFQTNAATACVSCSTTSARSSRTCCRACDDVVRTVDRWNAGPNVMTTSMTTAAIAPPITNQTFTAPCLASPASASSATTVKNSRKALGLNMARSILVQ